jgi:putative MATE family efflux protein
MTEGRLNIFFHKTYTPRILKLALPVVLSMLSVTILINVDIMMVGKLGKDAVAATGLGNWVYLIVIITLSAIEIGTQVLVARRFGERHFKECGRIATIGVVISLVVGSLVLALMLPFAHKLLHSNDATVKELGLAYLHIRLLTLPFGMTAFALRGFFYGIGNSVIPMITEIVINLMNIILNYLLIFGKFGFPAMGVRGAALGSLLSTMTGCTLLFVMALRPSYRRKFHLPALLGREIKPTLMQMFRISYPVFFQSFVIHLGLYIFLLINDRISVTAVAASNIVLTILCISFLPANGFGIAAATLIGQSLGEGEPHKARNYGWLSLGPGIIIMIFASFLFIFFGRPLMRFYIEDPDVIEAGARALFLVGLVEICEAFNIILSRGLQGAGHTLYVMIVETSINWFLFLPATYVLGVVLGWGITGTWIAIMIYIVVFAFAMLTKFITHDWTKTSIPPVQEHS